MMNGWNGSGWDVFWMMLGMVVFWGALVAVVWLLVRSERGRSRGPGNDRQDAIELLRRRYAAGEIAQDEYEERLAVLKSSSS